MFRAQIEFMAFEDDWNEGQSLQNDNYWTETLEAETAADLREKVLAATYSKWGELDGEQINEYDHATEYHTSYLADAENEGAATPAQIELWKQGKLRLWAVNCHILVTEVTEKKAAL